MNVIVKLQKRVKLKILKAFSAKENKITRICENRNVSVPDPDIIIEGQS